MPDMKSFSEFCEDEILEEGILRTGAISAYASQSKKAGDNAVKSYRRGRQLLKQRHGSEQDVDARLDSLEGAIDAMLQGLEYQREQIGHSVAVNVAASMLAAKIKCR